ncbi:MAG: HD domain-containing protein [Candidatus Omnitrophica bacterium]|nr:HD domain-containing protein [Candidatus Omnitrophota bacterium]
MAINYKKELETAAKTMILVREPNTLIKMIVRMIVHKVKVNHASIFLFDELRQSYILTVSKGKRGLKIPKEFTRMDFNNPLIRLFREGKNKILFSGDVLVFDEGKRFLSFIADSDLKILLEGAITQLELYESVVCIPSYFKDNLLGILLLGTKEDGTSFDREELDFFVALAQDVAMAVRNAQLFYEQKKLYLNITLALAAAIEAKDHYTSGHTSRVTNIALAIAEKYILKNPIPFDERKFLEDVQIASSLHDIGKIGVPEYILNKQGALTEAEWRVIKEHPMTGVKILMPIGELKTAILGVQYHHEHYDGSGYPEGLKGEQIPIIAAIIGVADAYDAMTSDRPYRKGLSPQQAIEEIKRQSGRQFHPIVVEAFLEVVKERSL